ncbi:MAG: phosphodiester glycosidase family protein [Armatimonadetes bacterium]|nr:phosphodiester glycosidase family protein [Armatimonadota bacterium]
MSRLTSTLAATLCVHALWAGDPQKPIEYRTVKSGGATYHAVIAHMRTQRVAVSTVASKSLQSARSMVNNAGATVAVTGTFFSTSSGIPVADVIVNGKRVAEGRRGSILGVTWSGDVKVFDADFNQDLNWFDYRYALRGTVRIVTQGKVSADPKGQKFTDRRLWSSTARTAAGVTRSGDMVIMATKSGVYLSDIARAMLRLGVSDAVALDGGSSTCLYYRNKFVCAPQRNLSTMVVLKELTPDEGEWAMAPLRRRHTGTANYLITCPSKWPTNPTRRVSATAKPPVTTNR